MRRHDPQHNNKVKPQEETTLDEDKLRLFGHIFRMNMEIMAKITQVEGRRPRERPKITWEEGMQEAFRSERWTGTGESWYKRGTFWSKLY